MTTFRRMVTAVVDDKPVLWTVVWLSGLASMGIWDAIFLNQPAFVSVRTAFYNTLFSAALVVTLALCFGWSAGVLLYFMESRRRELYLGAAFLLNVIRSVPQIVGILLGYVVLTFFIEHEMLRGETAQLAWMSLSVSLFVFSEVVDLIRERISYFSKLDFVDAMLCCGIKEHRVINREILWKNSRAHLFQKMVSVFGAAVFLQCSIDFVISVGLTSDVSSSNFPPTLGSMLAKLDSKQDILAVGRALLDPGGFFTLFHEHLQGISIAFLIVFTLVCVYNIANSISSKYTL